LGTAITSGALAGSAALRRRALLAFEGLRFTGR
jgi:hypothetical protein